MKKESQEITKEDIIKDIQETNIKYKQEFGEEVNYVTRDYYARNGTFKKEYIEELFGSFTNAKNASFVKERKKGNVEKSGNVEKLSLQKKLIRLEERAKELEKEKKELLKKNINEDDLIILYNNSLNDLEKINIDNSIITLEDDENRIALLQLSDWHIGESVIAEQVNYVNEYNESICIKRLDTIFNIFITYCKKFNITKCNILLNGDIISGGIHTELVRNTWCNEIEQIFFAQKYLIQKLEYLSKFFNFIDIDILVGNHSRILQGRPYFKEKVKMNFEYILGKNLEMYFNLLKEQDKNNKININVPESPFYIKEINGIKFLETHGDILTGAGSGGFAGIPFYSICMSASKLYGILHQIGLSTETKFDHILVGHLHTESKIPLFNGGFCYIGGCVIGTNEYSITKMRSVAKKSQLLLIVDNSGHIELEKNIIFD